MPRELTLVTRRPPTVDELRDAAREHDPDAIVANVRNGAVQMVLDARRDVILSMQYSTFVGVPDEIATRQPAAATAVPGPAFWTEVWIPFGPTGHRSAAIARGIAERCQGVCADESGELL
ncbi:hypothetical protein F8O01_13160 [Pseudoclavibacter chungangensis]|uniref:Uncharacterized protein n=1 Tax=Pseudoclavibacter chungangensis TaxID=587635 RepID=A0A7J5BPH1_9MICO|nr:hypothetical protein [Pseudoclavibacter chungangensis]KAB1654839.1 hypothetical protein F8O01_13160 [Pseudoclavibacter chungangensis]NYJ68038.1 hypothetical protein [Pseudoclavibacter chungangensis]